MKQQQQVLYFLQFLIWKLKTPQLYLYDAFKPALKLKSSSHFQ